MVLGEVRLHGSGFPFQGFGVRAQGFGFGFQVQGFGTGFQDFGFGGKVQGVRLRVKG